MIEIKYTITLRTDGEPGTGLGTQSIQDLIPRNHRGDPTVPSTHLKGLLRDSITKLVSARGWFDAHPDEWPDRLLGSAGTDGSDGTSSLARLSAATPAVAKHGGTPIGGHTITRTAMDETGKPRAGSLRTSESIPAGTVFSGTVRMDAPAKSIEDVMIRVGLLGIGALGGNRTRGAGRCVIAIEGESRRPSALLQELQDAGITSPAAARSQQSAPVTRPARAGGSGSTCLLLEFDARDPICCPELPLTETNVVRGGFSVPASAVQGALLGKLNEADPDLASATFADSDFRCWPLLPVAPAGADRIEAFPVYTSLTHRMSKPPGSDFRDPVFEALPWRQVAAGAPLKAADGVLLRGPDSVRLWRERDMPRQVTAHVSLSGGGPLLFTVEAMSPMRFAAIVNLPNEACEQLTALLTADPLVWFGKARSVRGGGHLTIRALPDAMSQFLGEQHRTFIVQSPIGIPEDLAATASDRPAGSVLSQLVERAGWGTVEQAEASLGMRFGWNRHGIGSRTSGRNRLRAQAVVLPGSVFRLQAAPTDLVRKLTVGIGTGRERGFGAILPHPGVATDRLKDLPEAPTLHSRDNAGTLALELIEIARGSGLSRTQIAGLHQAARMGRQRLGEELRKIRDQARDSIRDRYLPVLKCLDAHVSNHALKDSTLLRAIEAWRNASSSQKENQS